MPMTSLVVTIGIFPSFFLMIDDSGIWHENKQKLVPTSRQKRVRVFFISNILESSIQFLFNLCSFRFYWYIVIFSISMNYIILFHIWLCQFSIKPLPKRQKSFIWKSSPFFFDFESTDMIMGTYDNYLSYYPITGFFSAPCGAYEKAGFSDLFPKNQSRLSDYRKYSDWCCIRIYTR